LASLKTQVTVKNDKELLINY